MFHPKLLLFVAFLAYAFPREDDVKSRLRPGLTADQVVALFGEPNNHRAGPCLDCTFTYLAPLGNLTVAKEGYVGVRIWFQDGKVRAWHIYTGNPSYAEPTMPPGVRRFLWFFGIMFVLGLISKLLIRTTPVAHVVAEELAQTFEKRELQLDHLPTEFRFITHETTLQEVIDKAGDPSRVVKVPINPERGLGYALVSSGSGAATIVTYEYNLPYHAAVIVMPEFPFEPESRIRAVFYRPIQQELAEATE